MEANTLIRKAAEHAKILFADNANDGFHYHNIQHTMNVVAATERIADHYQLDEEDYVAVMVAAWYHDAGYLFVRYEAHEEKSVELATAFIESENGNPSLIAKISECIMATKMPQAPDSLIAKILCDADLFHFGTEEFKTVNKLLRKEVPAIIGKKIGAKEWRQKTLSLLEKHSFHTDYCKVLLQTGKQENIAWLKKKMEDDGTTGEDSKTNDGEHSIKKPSRGIETMFRTTSTNHLHLSEMADTKANTMITVNSIIASILVSVLFRKLEEDPRLVIPAILFLATSLVSIVLSIMVTRPNIVRGTFTKEDIEKKKVNLLFFGNFHKMSFEEYRNGVKAMMQDGEFLYGTMTRDIYNLGRVLGKKYRLLRIAYNLFMVGFIVSVLAFVIAINVAK